MLAIHLAAERGHERVIEYLSQAMCHSNFAPALEREDAERLDEIYYAKYARDSLGNTPLHYGASKKRASLIEWFSTNNLSMEMVNNNAGQTPKDLFDEKPAILYEIGEKSNSKSSFFVHFLFLNSLFLSFNSLCKLQNIREDVILYNSKC